MSTLTEVLLVIVISTLTITLTIIGIQVFLILRDVRDRITKIDPVLENLVVEQQYLNDILISAKDASQRVNQTTSYLSEEVVKPMGNILSAVKSISQLINQFRPKNKPSHHHYLDKDEEERRTDNE